MSFAFDFLREYIDLRRFDVLVRAKLNQRVVAFFCGHGVSNANKETRPPGAACP